MFICCRGEGGINGRKGQGSGGCRVRAREPCTMVRRRQGFPPSTGSRREVGSTSLSLRARTFCFGFDSKSRAQLFLSIGVWNEVGRFEPWVLYRPDPTPQVLPSYLLMPPIASQKQSIFPSQHSIRSSHSMPSSLKRASTREVVNAVFLAR